MMSQGRPDRFSKEMRKTVRSYYRGTMCVALSVVALVALFAGEQSISGIWDSDSGSDAEVGIELTSPVNIGRELLANELCAPIPDRKDVDEVWQARCCDKPPENKDNLEAWWKACRDTQYLSGTPYLACVKRWHGSAKNCSNTDGGLCSLKARCSDMGVYQKLGMAIGTAGFHPGMALPYVIVLLWLFMALAVVCDEYFVPAIDEISEQWNISPDVAGATLMAAGGSAPELATSFMGVFVSKSEVGFSTIVGSAVFNVLFVIGACAFASKEELVLSAWPLARDCSYYTVTLCALAMVYNYGPETATGGGTIEWWEAVIMLILYFGYVGMMKWNAQLQEAFIAKFSTAKVTPENEIENGNVGDGFRSVSSHKHWTCMRLTILDVVMRHKPVDEILGLVAVHKIKGDVRETFGKIDTDSSGFIDSNEIGILLKEFLLYEPSPEQVKQVMNELVTMHDDASGGMDQISFEEFEAWYTKSEVRVQAEMNAMFKKMDENNNGSITAEEFEKFCKEFIGEHKISEEEIATGLKKINESQGRKLSLSEFDEWYKDTEMFREEMERIQKAETEKEAGGEGGEEEGEGASLSFPADCKGRCWYLLLFPINATLYFTVPDVRWKNGWEKWYLVTFFASVIWIAVYAFFMVWFAVILGDSLGIPQSVMGLTLLAMGTSVPDMISSVIVTLHGEGDMAVSSSIGSNIFDIGFGLPLPWILGNAAYGKGIELGQGCGSTIFVDVLLLLGMVVAVVVTVHFAGWKLTRPLGIVMFSLYFLFIIQSLLRTFLVSC